jgi:hypothetical protein
MNSPITNFLLYLSADKPSTFYNPGEKQAFAEQIRTKAGVIYANEYDAGVKIFGNKKAFDAFMVDLERNPKYYIELAGEEVQKMEGPLLPVNDFMSYFTDINNILKEAKDLNLDITKEADYKKFLAYLTDRGPGVLNMARETIIKYVDGLQAQEEANAAAVAIAPQMPKNFLWLIILGVIILIYINK